jgi:hypothetical protein
VRRRIQVRVRHQPQPLHIAYPARIDAIQCPKKPCADPRVAAFGGAMETLAAASPRRRVSREAFAPQAVLKFGHSAMACSASPSLPSSGQTARRPERRFRGQGTSGQPRRQTPARRDRAGHDGGETRSAASRRHCF